LKLCDFTERFEGVVSVRECEFAEDDVWNIVVDK
jgi:hypothetical protein